MIKRNTKQTGRSMLEMLGLLAIIGVLSVGGLAAYRQAMIHFQTNEVTNYIERIRLAIQEVCPDKTKDCNLFALTYTQRSTTLCALIGPDCKQSGGRSTLPYNQGNWLVYRNNPDGGSLFGLQLFNISKDLCTQIARRGFIGQLSYYVDIQLPEGTYVSRGKQPHQTSFKEEDIKDLVDACNSDDFANHVILYFQLY